MGKVLTLLGRFVVYCAIGTIAFELLAVGWLLSRGALTRETLTKIAALAQGIDIDLVMGGQHAPADDQSDEQPSIDDVALAEAMLSQQLQRREVALEQRLERFALALNELKKERADVNALKAAFTQELQKAQQAAAESGRAAVAATLESSRAREAKRQLQLMIKEGEINQAVALFERMPVRSRANIAAEFKTEEEAKQLYDIYRLMREGIPETTLINRTQNQLDAFGGE